MKESDDIEKFLKKRLQDKPVFDAENPSVPLVAATYGAEEMVEALDSMTSTFLTSGKKVEDFEESWSEYNGSETGVMVNSGSSANLAALKAVSQDFDSDAEVIVPAVGWSTTVFPVIDAGATPVFVDVDPETLRMDTESVEEAVNQNTEAIMVVHLLGKPAPMDEILRISRENDLRIIEDCAEAHGAEWKRSKVGSIGDIGTFSFSFSHHITTSEGGIAITDSKKYEQRMKVLRSWGSAREAENVEEKTGIGVTFISHGYNLRATEIQAAFGIHQIDKMEDIVDERRENALYMNSRLQNLDEITVLEDSESGRCSYLHYPIIIDPESDYERDRLREYLEDRGIETRPLLSGNMARHPAFQEECRSPVSLEGADKIHFNGLYVSCHSYLEKEHLDHIVECITQFFND